MHTVIGSSGRDCVFITLFPLYGSNAGLIQDNLFRVGQYDSLPPSGVRGTSPQPSYWKIN